jgi:hypothetical protein
MNPTGQNGKHAVEDMAQHVNKAGAAAQQFFDEAKASGQGLMEAVNIQGRVERNPYGMVAAALGIGYLLGGGLFTSTTARIFRLGIKAAAVPLVRDQVLAFAENAIDGVLDRARKMNSTVNDIPLQSPTQE